MLKNIATCILAVILLAAAALFFAVAADEMVLHNTIGQVSLLGLAFCGVFTFLFFHLAFGVIPYMSWSKTEEA